MDKCELCDIRSLTVADRGMRDVNVMLVCDMCWAVQEQGLSEWAQDDEMHRSYMRGIDVCRDQTEVSTSWAGLDNWVESVRRASDVHAEYANELTRMAREDGL